jgi:hypothetical protein
VQTLAVTAQVLVYSLLGLMPSSYQRESFQALLGMFWEGQGKAHLQNSTIKSASALSRFLNHYQWNTRGVIQAVRATIIEQLLTDAPRGRRPHLQVIVDLTTLEKCGKFKQFESLITVYNKKRGLHLVVLYLVVGEWRIPWGFRVWRGKGSTSPAQLAIRLIDTLPRKLLKAYRVKVLADTGFGSNQFITAMKKRRLPLIVGVGARRRLADSRYLKNLVHKGQSIRLDGLDFEVFVSWFYLKRDGKLEQRFVISTCPLKGSTIAWWGRRRWSIEGFFKTAKHRFGLHCFAQKTLLGVYRWLVLCMISFVLAHWSLLSQTQGKSSLPDWGKAASLALNNLCPAVKILQVLKTVQSSQTLFASFGFELRLVPLTS